jgi:hypothetical protein
MPVKFDTAPPRGMKDLLPAEVELRDRATAFAGSRRRLSRTSACCRAAAEARTKS